MDFLGSYVAFTKHKCSLNIGKRQSVLKSYGQLAQWQSTAFTLQGP